jgi:hypothetical protein
MNENIKEQINKLSLKVKEMIQEKMEQNVVIRGNKKEMRKLFFKG